jgi:hypothetical protein
MGSPKIVAWSQPAQQRLQPSQVRGASFGFSIILSF